MEGTPGEGGWVVVMGVNDFHIHLGLPALLLSSTYSLSELCLKSFRQSCIT